MDVIEISGGVCHLVPQGLDLFRSPAWGKGARYARPPLSGVLCIMKMKAGSSAGAWPSFFVNEVADLQKKKAVAEMVQGIACNDQA